MARNAQCPGFTAFFEGLFMSVSKDQLALESSTLDPWLLEYMQG